MKLIYFPVAIELSVSLRPDDVVWMMTCWRFSSSSVSVTIVGQSIAWANFAENRTGFVEQSHTLSRLNAAHAMKDNTFTQREGSLPLIKDVFLHLSEELNPWIILSGVLWIVCLPTALNGEVSVSQDVSDPSAINAVFISSIGSMYRSRYRGTHCDVLSRSTISYSCHASRCIHHQCLYGCISVTPVKYNIN